VTIIYSLTYAAFVYDTYTDVFPNPLWQYLAFSVTGFLWLCMAVSYYLIIHRGPGYVPYNWQATRHSSYDWITEMNNIVVFSEQGEQARTSQRPPRASFSINARRFVLRADHFCLWARSWIGLKNYRFFLLMTIYAFLYMIAYAGFRVFWILHIIKKWQWIYLLGSITTLFVIIVGCFALCYFWRGSVNAVRNITQVELHKRNEAGEVNPVNEFDKGCGRNCEEICGPRWLMPCWIFPCCACFQLAENGLYLENVNEFTELENQRSEFSVVKDPPHARRSCCA
jgi:hypothetical protein